jgi:phosphoribosylanthranilate isomerase
MTKPLSMDNKPKIKLCGQTRLEDVRFSFESGADFCGVVINVPSSPRTMSVETAGPLFKEYAPKLFALTANAGIEQISEIAKTLKPGYFQFTANESPEFIGEVVGRFGTPVFKSIHLPAEDAENSNRQKDEFLALMKKYGEAGCAGFVLDSKSKGMFGGTGVKSDWNLAREIITATKEKVFLAGGLSPENIAEAKALEPYGLDLASGVEISPGIKSKEKITSLFKALR